MISIYICEDNNNELQLFTYYVKKILMIEEKKDFSLVCATSDPDELLAQVSEQDQQSLFFLDIAISDKMDGLELGKRLRIRNPSCFLVYITAHSDLVFRTFQYKLEALDFIQKDKPQEIYKRMQECIEQVWNIYQSAQRRGIRSLTIKNGSYTKLIPLSEICYIETSKEDAHSLYIHLLNATLRCSGLLKQIEAQLDETFFRCHKSYYINLNMIDSIDYKMYTIQMKNRQSVLLSTRKRKDLEKCLQKTFSHVLREVDNTMNQPE